MCTPVATHFALPRPRTSLPCRQAVITLAEVPDAITLRANELRPGSSPGVPVLALADGVDLRAPAFTAMFALASEARHSTAPQRQGRAQGVSRGQARSVALVLTRWRAAQAMGRDLPLLRFDVDSGTNWNGPPLGASLLPSEMLPFSASPRVLLAAPPTRGVWKAGAMVWAVVPTLSLAGWICNASGSPGTWEAFGFSRGN